MALLARSIAAALPWRPQCPMPPSWTSLLAVSSLVTDIRARLGPLQLVMTTREEERRHFAHQPNEALQSVRQLAYILHFEGELLREDISTLA